MGRCAGAAERSIGAGMLERRLGDAAAGSECAGAGCSGCRSSWGCRGAAADSGCRSGSGCSARCGLKLILLLPTLLCVAVKSLGLELGRWWRRESAGCSVLRCATPQGTSGSGPASRFPRDGGSGTRCPSPPAGCPRARRQLRVAACGAVSPCAGYRHCAHAGLRGQPGTHTHTMHMWG